MSDNWKPSNEPGRYDKARVGQLRPVHQAVERLQLLPLRLRQIGGILNALTMQIEAGGDSPEVNRLLLDALRAAVRHQADEHKAGTVLRAIDAFEQAEAKRWEQVRSGTLPPPVLSPEEQLDELMQEGYDLLQARQRTAACDRWLEAWELVKQMADMKAMHSVRDFDKAHSGLFQSVFNWCQDLELELGNAGLDDRPYNEHRLRYAREFLARFPNESTGFQVNFARAQGEAL
ncbi:MAG: hypothetical protein EPO21_09030 [Chloroflexota bacterium]|nr:MAG: hypothetical protein EPO21_09030 [Chloroflexota bacterium]